MATKTSRKSTKKRTVYGTHVTTPTGTRVYVSGRTKKERDDKVQQMRQELLSGVNIVDDTLFEDYARQWLRVYKAKIRPGSRELVRANLENHVIPFFQGQTLREIRPMHLQIFLNGIADYSNSLQAKCVQIVKAIFRTATTNRLISVSPVDPDTFKAGGDTSPEVQPLTLEQTKRLLDAVRGTRAYTFCLLALTTGLRRGELLGLMWEDIDLDEAHPMIHVRHNKAIPANKADAPVTELLKTEAASRNIPLPAGTARHLRDLKEQAGPGAVFVLAMENGKSLTRSSFRSLWEIVATRTEGDDRKIGQKVRGSKTGLVCLDFTCHPHQLRHTYATRLFEAGCDVKQVQYLLGHSKPEMTMRIYVHYQEQTRARETSDSVNAALGALA